MSEVWVLKDSEFERAPLPVFTGLVTTAVLKPNWVRDYNEKSPEDPSLLAEVVSSPDLLLAIAKRLAPVARDIVIADAPQFDANWDRLWGRLGLGELLERARTAGLRLEIRDLRQETVRTDTNGVIIERVKKMADPRGYRIVDLRDRSAFAGSGFDFGKLRGADFDASETIRHHSGGSHRYCIAGTALDADLVVNVPKMKTHKKSGVTLCLKNLVGINGNKNYLPHHRAGRPEDGGDEFPGGRGDLYGRARAWLIDQARPLLKSSVLTPLIRSLRAVDMQTRPANVVRNGNWSGNDTIWRTILDLNRVLVYCDRNGALQSTPQRRTFHVMDGIVAGEGDGPMAPDRRDPGLIICSADPVAADTVASALMGFDPLKIPVIREACRPHPLPITQLGPALEGLVVHYAGETLRSWRELPNLAFRPHPGWVGCIERDHDPTDYAIRRAAQV